MYFLEMILSLQLSNENRKGYVLNPVYFDTITTDVFRKAFRRKSLVVQREIVE